jgi:formylglycine-generating enzyme required for sulfatase activity
MIEILTYIGGAIAATGAFIGVVWRLFYGNKTILDVRHKLPSIGVKRLIYPKSRVEQVISEYLREVKEAHSHLRFGDPLSSLQAQDPSNRIELTEIYTPLNVATEFKVVGDDVLTNQPARLSLSAAEALKNPDAHRVVVLGAPGAGKSTLVDMLVLGEISLSRCPVHVRLADLSASKSPSIWNAVSEIHDVQTATEAKKDELVAALNAKLESGEGVIYFDGLDEVSEEHTADIINLIKDTEKTFSKAQIVITCRATDYEQRSLAPKLPFTLLRLLPFTLSEMLDYVDKWYNQLERLRFVTDAAARKRNLQDAIRNSIELAQLGSNPLVLNLMALVHTSEGELPRSRAVLYQRTVSHLLSESPNWRRKFGSLTVSQSEIQPIASSIAYLIHERELDQASKKVGLALLEIEAVVIRNSSGVEIDNPAVYRRHKDRVSGIVQRLVNSNGLLVEVSHGRYGFAHRSLQEFLVGQHILDLADVELIRRISKKTHWHEPLVLMAGYGGREGSATFFIATVIDALVKDAMTDSVGGARLAILTGEMLAEIGASTLRARSQSWVLDGRPNQSGPSTWDHVAHLISDASKRADVGLRVELLGVLGRLGDPRLVQRNGELVPFVERLVYLPPAQVEVGDSDPSRPKAKSELVETLPKRRIMFDAVHVPMFMVTNIEYGKFISDGGYSEKSFWTDEGLKWLSGDATFRSKLEEKTREWIERDFGPELLLGKYRLDDILSDAREMSKARSEPFYWRNERYNRPNQPVVGVNLWEAMAFCRWLEATLKASNEIASDVRIRLPREWEWERVARGARMGSVYPWGNEPHTRERAHTRAAKLGLDFAAPVGCFPEGKTDHNLFDIAGNAWEWTVSRAVPPSDEFDIARDDVSGIVDVVVRGGSWFSDEPESVRCGYRGIDLPQNVYFDVGLRPFVFNYKVEERHRAIGTEALRRAGSSRRYQS